MYDARRPIRPLHIIPQPEVILIPIRRTVTATEIQIYVIQFVKVPWTSLNWTCLWGLTRGPSDADMFSLLKRCFAMIHVTNAKMSATNDVRKDRSDNNENRGYGYILRCREHITGISDRAAIRVMNAAERRDEIVRHWILKEKRRCSPTGKKTWNLVRIATICGSQ